MSTARGLPADFIQVAKGVVGLCRRLGREAASRGLPNRERMLDRLGAVSREEFDSVREMAQNARVENERLAKRITQLESGKRKTTSRRRTSAKKAGPASE